MKKFSIDSREGKKTSLSRVSVFITTWFSTWINSFEMKKKKKKKMREKKSIEFFIENSWLSFWAIEFYEWKSNQIKRKSVKCDKIINNIVHVCVYSIRFFFFMSSSFRKWKKPIIIRMGFVYYFFLSKSLKINSISSKFFFLNWLDKSIFYSIVTFIQTISFSFKIGGRRPMKIWRIKHFVRWLTCACVCECDKEEWQHEFF